MKSRYRFIILAIVIVAVFLCGGLYLDQSHRTTASDQPTTDISLGVTPSDRLVIRYYYDSQEQLNAVAGLLDTWEVNQLPGVGASSGYAIAAVYPSQKDWLELMGYRVEVDQAKTAELLSPTAALDPRYYYFDPYNSNSMDRYMVEFMQTISDTYPNLTELIDIGDAWQATQGEYHRDIWALRITNEDPQYGEISNKPPFILLANIHAREVSTPEMAIRYIKYLTGGYRDAGGYGIDPDATWLVNHHVVYVIVSENPDGHTINEQDINAYWRKNVDDDDGCNSSYGVDLNRNSSFKWGCCGGSSPNACDATYRGPIRASEPETQAIQAFATQIFGDWNGNNGDDEFPPAAPDTTPGILISLHSYQDEILWAYECSPSCGTPPNGQQLTTIGRKLADITGVMIPTGFLYTVDGGTIDFIYGKLGVAAYTYEIGPTGGTCADFFPPYGCQDGIDGMPRDFWAEMSPSWVYANKIAGSPYKTAYGPDTLSLSVTPDSAPAGLPVDLAGTIKDQRYSNDPLKNIVGAEYFIDAPGADGTGIAMLPADGEWNSSTENVEAVVETGGLLSGQHYILVHGLNIDGKWGPFTAIFLSLTTPDFGVYLSPAAGTAQADPGTTVTYNMQVMNVGQNGDAFDISVLSAWDYLAPSSVGYLAPGETFPFDVQVTIPFTATNGESDTAVVSVVSQAHPESQDSSNLDTTANFFDLSLTPPTAAKSGKPNQVIKYVLTLTNNGNQADSYNITFTSQWPVTAPASLGPLNPGASTQFDVSVTIPAGAAPGEFDQALITATSQGDGTRLQSSTLTTTANATYGFTVVPVDDTVYGHANGTTVEFTVIVSNTGNIADTYDIHISPGGWQVDAPAEVGPIDRNSSAAVTITIRIPLDIKMGDSSTSKIIFISQGSRTGHQVTLYTKTFWYSSFIPLSIKH